MNKINIGIIGGAGYTGGELIRLLINHPDAEIVYIRSTSNEGQYVSSVHKDLIGETNLIFEGGKPSSDVDVVFLCLGHGQSKNFLNVFNFKNKVKVIDLSQDFRLGETIQLRSFIYGLPELNREQIKTANNIANPGCFATAIQLALLPVAKAGLLSDVYTTGITGSTGAGQGLSDTSHFSWRANNVQAYKTLQHQHVAEIIQSLNQVAADVPSPCLPDRQALEKAGVRSLNFIPWRGDFTRGIYTSSTVDCKLDLEKIKNLYKEFYSEHPFTYISESMIDLKQAVNTNKCLVHLEKQGDKLVIHSTLDNLLKGASGQAVQNMNLMFGLDETTGLKLKANYF
jgi:N-acetyl-gamma-glutamyl-phosphate reductase